MASLLPHVHGPKCVVVNWPSCHSHFTAFFYPTIGIAVYGFERRGEREIIMAGGEIERVRKSLICPIRSEPISLSTEQISTIQRFKLIPLEKFCYHFAFCPHTSAAHCRQTTTTTMTTFTNRIVPHYFFFVVVVVIVIIFFYCRRYCRLLRWQQFLQFGLSFSYFFLFRFHAIVFAGLISSSVRSTFRPLSSIVTALVNRRISCKFLVFPTKSIAFYFYWLVTTQ